MDVRVRGKATARPKEVKGPTLGKAVERATVAPGHAIVHSRPRAERWPVRRRASIGSGPSRCRSRLQKKASGVPIDEFVESGHRLNERDGAEPRRSAEIGSNRVTFCLAVAVSRIETPGSYRDQARGITQRRAANRRAGGAVSSFRDGSDPRR